MSSRRCADPRIIGQPSSTTTANSVLVSAPAPGSAASSRSAARVQHALVPPAASKIKNRDLHPARPLSTKAQTLQPSAGASREVAQPPSRGRITTLSAPATPSAESLIATSLPGGNLTAPRSPVSSGLCELTAPPRLSKQPSQSACLTAPGPSVQKATTGILFRSSPPTLQGPPEEDGGLQSPTKAQLPWPKPAANSSTRRVPRESQLNVVPPMPDRLEEHAARPPVKRRKVAFAEKVEVKMFCAAGEKPARKTLRNSFPIDDAPRALRAEVYESPR